MLAAVLANWLTKPGGVYIDATVGGGGHTAALLQNLNAQACVIGIDRDPEAIRHVQETLGQDPRLRLLHGSFSDISSLLRHTGFEACTGILADLGVSSHQIDTAARGFSFMADGPLDLRMNPESGEPASALLDRVDERELTVILRDFGEERHAKRAARLILTEHRRHRLTRTSQLVAAVEKMFLPPHRIKSLARIFQALRIAVNRELDELAAFLPAAFDRLEKGGRLVVLAYHSLEDRAVKQFFAGKARECVCPPEAPVCICGGLAKGRLLTKKPLSAEPAEIEQNPRARSAKLRAIEKN